MESFNSVPPGEGFTHHEIEEPKIHTYNDDEDDDFEIKMPKLDDEDLDIEEDDEIEDDDVPTLNLSADKYFDEDHETFTDDEREEEAA